MTGAATPTPCEAGTYSDGIGATSKTTCQTCPKAFYCRAGAASALKCPTGTYGPTDHLSRCQLCPPNTYNPNEGQDSNLNCLSCPAGTVSLRPGARNRGYCEVVGISTIVIITGVSFGTHLFPTNPHKLTCFALQSWWQEELYF